MASTLLQVFPRARRLPAVLIAVLVMMLPSGISSAHGPIHDQIRQISADIGRATGYADLYLVRAALYRLDQDWDRAEADLATAERLGALPAAIGMIRVDMNLDRNRFEKALEALIPLRRIRTPDVMFSHVRAYLGLGDLDSALFWLDLCLNSSEAVPADWYLLRCNLTLQRDPENIDEALSGLEDGLRTRGFDIALALRCLDLEASAARYESALDRLSTLEAVLQRDEELLSRRGDILLRAGRKLEAEAAYTEALSALESLPPSRRSSPATQELESHLRTALEEGNSR